MFIMAVGNIMSVSFERCFLLQNELTYDVSDIISTFVYRKGLSGGQYSYTTAIDMFSTVTNFVMLLVRTACAGCWANRAFGEEGENMRQNKGVGYRIFQVFNIILMIAICLVILFPSIICLSSPSAMVSRS